MLKTPYEAVLLDFETSGLDPSQCEIIEIGAVKFRFTPDANTEGGGQFEILDRYQTLIQPMESVPLMILQLTGIEKEELEHAPTLESMLPGFMEFMGELPVIAHNSAMEEGFLNHQIAPRLLGLELKDRKFSVINSIDPLALLLADHSSHSMESMRKWAGVDNDDAHRALKDCEDLFKVLEFAKNFLEKERPEIKKIVHHFFRPSLDKAWGWSWFFGEPDQDQALSQFLPALLKHPPMGDLREMKSKDSERTVDWSNLVPVDQIQKPLIVERPGFEFRPQQLTMADAIRVSLNEGTRVAIEAPTGTGKSVAYLLPGVLAARASGVPLVVSTHSKSLQDQLIEKDLPRVRELLPEISSKDEIRGTTVKGQDNYLCLRKTIDYLTTIDSMATEDEIWAGAYIASLAHLNPKVEIDRISHYLRINHPALGDSISQIRSHHSTTIGPGCPYYSSCHYFNSARQAHNSDVIIANHSLVFQWPKNLPQIRNIVFDEAHHLEDRITETHSVNLTEDEIAEAADRFSRKQGSRRFGDLQQILSLIEGLELPQTLQAKIGDKGLEVFLTQHSESIKSRLTQLRALLPMAFERRDGREPSGYEESAELRRIHPEVKNNLIESFMGLRAVTRELSEFLTQTAELCSTLRGDSRVDLLVLHADRFTGIADRISPFLERDEKEWLKLLHYDPKEWTWRFQVAPIEVKILSAPFFADLRSVALTSATLSTGQSPTFVTDRIGIALAQPLIQLPSPYDLAHQATVFIPEDIAPPGTPSHLDALIGFTEQVVTALEGRTLLLLSNNRRLKQAAEILRDKLTSRGITVFDSLNDRKAAENFQNAENALLIGGERYGEGLDIPGRKLTCVIIEKINEAMTRGPLAEARKAKTRFALFDYDFPIRMMWLKQRVGRLIRSPMDTGAVVIFDARYFAWSASSQNVVKRTIAPIPILTSTREKIVAEIEKRFG